MASIYTYETADTITVGLQGSNVCDEAVRAARSIAAEREESVVLEDDDGCWLVHPDGGCEELDSNWAGAEPAQHDADDYDAAQAGL